MIAGVAVIIDYEAELARLEAEVCGEPIDPGIEPALPLLSDDGGQDRPIIKLQD